MTDKLIIDGKQINCPCYIDRPLYRYNKACLIQSQAFTEQQTKEKPILRCDQIKDCMIKENVQQLKRLQAELEAKEKENAEYKKYLETIKQECITVRDDGLTHHLLKTKMNIIICWINDVLKIKTDFKKAIEETFKQEKKGQE